MEEPKLCPLLKEPCIQDRCMFWVSMDITLDPGIGQEGLGPRLGALPEDCAFYHLGALALRMLYIPGAGALKPPEKRFRDSDEGAS